MEDIECQHRFKVCIFGDGAVGKTTLTNRFLQGVFTDNYEITIGMNFYVKKIEINGIAVSLQVWDFAGEERFRFLLLTSILGAHGAIFMHDITRYSTFKNLSIWSSAFREAIKNEGREIPAILVGSKLDLKENRVVSLEEAQKFGKENNLLDYLECSSKTGENVDSVFKSIGQIMLQRVMLVEKAI